MASEYALVTLPWAAALSAVALYFAWRSYRAASYRRTVRRLGWALVPWALWLVGLLRLVLRIGSALSDWAAGFAFNPSVWLGIAIGALAALLIVAGGGRRRTAVEAGSTRAVGAGRPGRRQPVVDEDVDDIDAILRKHGIS